jgi:hypothetical protein
MIPRPSTHRGLRHLPKILISPPAPRPRQLRQPRQALPSPMTQPTETYPANSVVGDSNWAKRAKQARPAILASICVLITQMRCLTTRPRYTNVNTGAVAEIPRSRTSRFMSRGIVLAGKGRFQDAIESMIDENDPAVLVNKMYSEVAERSINRIKSRPVSSFCKGSPNCKLLLPSAKSYRTREYLHTLY